MKSGLRRYAPPAAFLLAFLATLAPVTAHNVIRGGDNVLLTSHAGFNFYIGNNADSEGVFVAPEGTGSNVETQIADSRHVAERALGRPLKASEVSRYWSDRAMEFIRANPGRFLWLCGRKILLFFDAREISDINDYAFERNFNPFLNFPWLSFAALGPLLIVGLVISVPRSRYRALVYLWIFGYLAGLVTFFINARYRLPLLGLFFPVAAMGALDIYEAVKSAAWKKAALYAAVLAAGVALTQLALVKQDRSQNYINAGDVFLEQKDYRTALGYFEKALEVNPESPKGNLSMGMTLTGLRRGGEAKSYYLKSLALKPSSQAYNNLGMLANGAGDTEEAERMFFKAVELNPDSPQAYNNLGMVYGNRGDFAKARKMLEKSLAINPENPRTYTNLGLVYYRLGQPQEALRLWHKALEIDPHFEEALQVLRLSGAEKR